MCKVNRETKGFVFELQKTATSKNKRINKIQYAGDLILFMNTTKEMENKIDKWTEVLRRYKLQVSTKMTNIMNIDHQSKDIQIVSADKTLNI